MATELVSMSRKEIDRLDVIRRVVERRLTQVKAAQLLGLGLRQVGRLCAAYERHGPPGLVSRHRGKASNRRLPEVLQLRALDLVRERCPEHGTHDSARHALSLRGCSRDGHGDPRHLSRGHERVVRIDREACWRSHEFTPGAGERVPDRFAFWILRAGWSVICLAFGLIARCVVETGGSANAMTASSPSRMMSRSS